MQHKLMPVEKSSGLTARFLEIQPERLVLPYYVEDLVKTLEAKNVTLDPVGVATVNSLHTARQPAFRHENTHVAAVYGAWRPLIEPLVNALFPVPFFLLAMAQVDVVASSAELDISLMRAVPDESPLLASHVAGTIEAKRGIEMCDELVLDLDNFLASGGVARTWIDNDHKWRFKLSSKVSKPRLRRLIGALERVVECAAYAHALNLPRAFFVAGSVWFSATINKDTRTIRVSRPVGIIQNGTRLDGGFADGHPSLLACFIAVAFEGIGERDEFKPEAVAAADRGSSGQSRAREEEDGDEKADEGESECVLDSSALTALPTEYEGRDSTSLPPSSIPRPATQLLTSETPNEPSTESFGTSPPAPTVHEPPTRSSTSSLPSSPLAGRGTTPTRPTPLISSKRRHSP